MSFDQKMQVATLVVSVITAICSTIIILAKMKSYVTVEEYRTSKAALHAELNAANIQIARLEVEVGYLRGGKL